MATTNTEINHAIKLSVSDHISFILIFTQKSGHPVKFHTLSFRTQPENNSSAMSVF